MEGINHSIARFIHDHEFLISLIIMFPFWTRSFINSFIINRRDKTDHFVLFLNPFSASAWSHGLEGLFRFYWSVNGSNKVAKLIVNYLSLIFWILVIIVMYSLSTTQSHY